MIYLNKIFIFFLIIFIYSCTNVGSYKSKEKIEKRYFTSKGFALIYEDSLYENKTIKKKIKNDEYVVLHSFLKKNLNRGIKIWRNTWLKPITRVVLKSNII